VVIILDYFTNTLLNNVKQISRRTFAKITIITKPKKEREENQKTKKRERRESKHTQDIYGVMVIHVTRPVPCHTITSPAANHCGVIVSISSVWSGRSLNRK
jgi:hypothetical protein